jgi:plasmid replication initiation protein
MEDKKTRKETRKIVISDNEWTYELRKHSSIIQMSNATTMLQRKSYNALLRIANEHLKKDENKRIFEVNIGKMKSLIWDQAINNKHLKGMLKQMQNTNVEYNILWKDKQEVRGSFNLLSRVQTENIDNPNIGLIKFEFPSIVLSWISNPRLYAKLDLFLMKSLESKHTIALYELLKDYQNLWKLYLAIEWLRKILSIKPKQYTSISMLKRKVLDVAIAEINEKTDLTVDYTIEKEWRSVSWIWFYIGYKHKKSLGIQEDTFVINDNQNTDLLKEVMQFWIPEGKAKEIVNSKDESYIRGNIETIKEAIQGWKVSNKTAFAIKAFTQDYRTKETEYDKAQKKKKDEKIVNEQKKQVEELKAKEDAERYEQERKEFIIMRDGKIDEFIATKSQEDLDQLKNQFIAKNANNPFMKHTKDWDMSHKLIKPMRYGFLSSELLPEHESNFDIYKKYGWGLF